ncbi:MAG: hypothetical protein IJ315_05180 [Firmicutes bacterium]|nr:hypothetical protein [Bacillota bacterium]
MTHRERFIRTLKCEKIGGQVPHFELVFFPTMEAFGKVNPRHRTYDQWGQMSLKEKQLHMNDIADVYIQTAKRYDYSAILVQGIPKNSLENTQWLLETIREKTGDEYYLMLSNDPTWAIPNGDNMMDFAVQMLEEPEKLNEISQRKMEDQLQFAHKLDVRGHLLDGFALCSDYCFNVNPFFTPDQFDELIAPYLKGVIDGYREMGYYSIKHTDGNIMPILKQMADCKPDAIHSLDPQGGVNLREVRKIVGPDMALIGNVNCGLLQTGSEEECDADVMRALREGMADGRGYIFATSNCVYPGLDLERYERMWKLWKQYGVYPEE